MYLPLVPNVVPTSARTAPSSSVMSSHGSTSTPTFETSTQIVMETPTPTPTPTLASPLGTINASIKCKVGVCIGEFVSMTLKVENQSQTDLHSIHLSLVRQISYASSTQPPYTYTSPESTTVNTAIIPIAKPNNAGSSWNQQLQFIIPTNLGLIPSISTAITPLFKVDYFVLVSIPIPQRRNSIVSRLINRKRSLSIFSSASSSIAETSLPGQAQTQQPSEKILPTKGPSAIQFTPIPIVVGTISPHNCHKRFKWPVPNYLEVTDRPTFVRDKFEEEMIKHLAGLESLIMEEDDDDNIDSLIYTAMGSGSSEESDDDDDPMQSRVPARFRSNNRVMPVSGLGTPPPSPPQYVASIVDDVQSIHSITESFGIDRNMYGAPSGHRSLGLGRSLLVARHHIKIQ
ncbi:hypothetical protein BGZ80_008528 [Entomortierella chlamydospora]|uniref:Arrestin C-terminal-like domain-containing protein n=1 Tax=Entomortierella chlamydospora TaxID=101097 RepID=A0A9P6T192_9FUNG|nr:hypothetical protein BGZ79_004168 [Entomortierella chlamydospora]KAG0017198.1 hypothetical protein BGZ80_008528 [Entomortierella chlamydospora]